MSGALHTRTQLHSKRPVTRSRKPGRRMQQTRSSAERRPTFGSRQPPCPSLQNVGYTISASEWLDEGAAWRSSRDQRLQHVLSRMNHHVHVRDEASGERKPLSSCRPKGKPNECKAGFPLENEMTDEAILVCPCVAEDRNLPSSGPRSRIGSILSARNDPWLNAAPALWCEFSGDNGGLKFPMRIPIFGRDA